MKIYLTFSLLISSQINADEVKCTTYAVTNKPSAIEVLATDCALQKNLANDEIVQKEHRKNVYDKLSTELANQIKQNSEDISLLTAFYNSNGQDLMMNSKEIAESCRLDSVKTIETCGGKKAGQFQDFKISLLKQKLPKNNNTPFSNDQSLYGIMAGKFYSDLGMNEKGNDLQCPLEGQSGSFMLQSQLDDLSANSIIDMIKNGSDSTFEKYPQLKIIKNTNDPKFLDKFTNYAKAKPSNVSAKDYISKFFFKKENQVKLAPTLANQCKRMNKNMNEFICSDLDELGSLDDNTSRSLFNKLNTTDSMEDQYEVDFNDPSVLTAYGMQCIAKENEQKNPDRSKAANFQSIDQWYADFTKNAREIVSDSSGQVKVDDFCNNYTCKSLLVKNNKSCKTGGPLKASDYSHSLGCDLVKKDEKCTVDALKTISYMQGLEKLKQGSKDHVIAANSASSLSSADTIKEAGQDTVVSGRLPNFAENYFGVEGSLKALGKPVTAYAITEKKQEFAENKLVSNEPIYSTPSAMKKEIAQQQKAPTMAASPDTSNMQPTFTPTATSQTTTTRPTLATLIDRTETAAATTKATAQKLSVTDNGTESSMLREEIEKMLADIKSTKKEMTEVQNNITSSSESRSDGAASGAMPIVNRAEQERLRRLEQSLTEKANRLEEYRRELDNRNFAQSGFGTEGSAARSPASGASNGISSAPGGANPGFGNSATGNSGLSNSLKLSSTTNTKPEAKATGSNYSAAIIQSGVESSTLTVDELSKLSTDKLKNLGINSDLPFTLKVIFDGRTYQVPVKSFFYKGARILGPIMDPKNKELNDFLLKSPLFRQYVDYRFDKENQTRASI